MIFIYIKFDVYLYMSNYYNYNFEDNNKLKIDDI